MYNENYFEDYRDEDNEPVIFSGALSHIQENLEAVLDVLYGETVIDIDEFERCLEEVVNGLGSSLPRSDLMIERKKKRPDVNICHTFFDTELCQKLFA